MGTWKSKNRHKYLLQYHIIFVCKYRKKLLVSRQISDDIKQYSYEICQRNSVIIRYMETDKDHIHYMIETEPTMSISKIVNLMKSYTTYHIRKRYPQYLRKQFWKEHTFWTDGYFACSVGNVSEEMLSICHSHAKTGSFDHRQIIISVTATDHLFSGQSDTR